MPAANVHSTLYFSNVTALQSRERTSVEAAFCWRHSTSRTHDFRVGTSSHLIVLVSGS